MAKHGKHTTHDPEPADGFEPDAADEVRAPAPPANTIVAESPFAVLEARDAEIAALKAQLAALSAARGKAIEAAPGERLDEKPPPYGTQIPAGPESTPRVVDQRVRANPETGLVRFKVSCRNYTPQADRYILARSEAEAEAVYLAANRLDKTLERIRKNAGPKADEVEAPALVVTTLPD